MGSGWSPTPSESPNSITVRDAVLRTDRQTAMPQSTEQTSRGRDGSRTALAEN